MPLMPPADATLCAKLHPDRFPSDSGKLEALLGYLTDQPVMQPEIVEAGITQDNFLVIRHTEASD